MDVKVEVGKTVEFRQHRGTLDGDETINWLLLCTRLVKLARVMDEDALSELVGEWINVLEVKGLDVLLHVVRHVIYLPEVADYYVKRGMVVDNDEKLVPIPEIGG
jgi:hypothetical protein